MKRILCMLAAMAALAPAQDKQTDPATVNVELTVYLLSGTLQGAAADDVPADLAPTVRQLHGLFTYKSYKLTESFILRGRNNVGQGRTASRTEGVLPGSGLTYTFNYDRVRVSSDKPRMVHLDGLGIRLTRPALPAYGNDSKRRPDETVASISTDLDLADGQKTVVGKSSINSAGDALILVIVPKVIE